MRLHVDNYRRILDEKGLSDQQVCKSTGLSEKTLNWILKNRYLEVATAELIADALGCEVKEIYASDSNDCVENVIEWMKDGGQATVTLSQRSMITRVKKLAAERPEECQIVAENEDGSICAHVPRSWIKIKPSRQLSEEQRKEISYRLNGK
ncbi:MAG: helix-turn-helix transcriptional regulator [Firmicutes bacterium]|nr:helix-turn-helix transcriptional regulator [Bacillota bacterium]